MKLKTYTATTMAQALAQVRKDLGGDAMILHTRSYRTGSWLGLGGKPMVEITASSPQPGSGKPRKARRVKQAQPAPLPVQESQLADDPIPEIVVQRARVAQPAASFKTAKARSAPQAIPQSPPADDRAALLQGLMGGGQPFDRHQLVDPTPNRDLDEPVQSVDQQPRSSEFEATTFRTFEPEELDQEPEPIVQPAKNDLVKAQAIEPAEPETLEPEAFEPEPLGLLESTMVFESVGITPSNSEHEESVVSVDVDESPEVSPQLPAQAAPSGTKPVAPEANALQEQIDTLQKMMGQVLDATRRTAVAVNKASPEGALPPTELSAPLHTLYTGMIDNDVPIDLADRFIGSVRDRLDADELNDASVVRHALLREIETSIQTVSESLLTTPADANADRTRPRVLALIGPTGVGKTTTVAKLAATAKLRHGKEVALITSDTYRIAAVEQLKTYASIIGLQLRIANTPDEMKSVIDSLSGVDLIVIDTAGRSQNNLARLDELGDLISAAEPDETHLVLSSTVGDNVLCKTAERFMDLGPDRCILTKIDEAVTTGMIAGMSDRIGLPLSFVTVGQEVPDDIQPARSERLARAVLDGPSAVVPEL